MTQAKRPVSMKKKLNKGVEIIVLCTSSHSLGRTCLLSAFACCYNFAENLAKFMYRHSLSIKSST